MLYKSKIYLLLKLLDIVWIYCDEYCIMGPRGRFTHVGIILSTVYGPKWPYWIYIAYIGMFGT